MNSNLVINYSNGAPAHLVFIPDDLSGVWVINSYVNTTIKVDAPSSALTSKWNRYAASGTTLVQYTPDTGMLRTMDFSWLAQKQPNPGVRWVDSPVSAELAKYVEEFKNSPKSGVTGSTDGTTGSPSKNWARFVAVDALAVIFGALSMILL
jgi:hypothetical protein